MRDIRKSERLDLDVTNVGKKQKPQTKSGYHRRNRQALTPGQLAAQLGLTPSFVFLMAGQAPTAPKNPDIDKPFVTPEIEAFVRRMVSDMKQNRSSQ